MSCNHAYTYICIASVEAYPDETVMEMHSQELCWQVGVTGDMVPGDISDNLLRWRTRAPVEILPQLASLAGP